MAEPALQYVEDLDTFNPYRWQSELLKIVDNQRVSECYIQKPSRVGMTTLATQAIFESLKRGENSAFLSSNLTNLRHWNSSFLTPCVMSDPYFANQLQGRGSRRSTTFSEHLLRLGDGAQLVMQNASVASGYRSWGDGVRWCVLDEYSHLDTSVKGKGSISEGNPSSLARGRLLGEPEATLLAMSTPTTIGDVLHSDLQSCDQHLDARAKCSDCKQYSSIHYDQLTSDAQHSCSNCGRLLNERPAKTWIRNAVRFVDTKTGLPARGLSERIGVRLHITLNPSVSWTKLKSVESKLHLMDYEHQIAFTNTVKGEHWQGESGHIDIPKLRGESREIALKQEATAHFRTCGVDVSDRGLHFLVLQINKGAPSEILHCDFLQCDPSILKNWSVLNSELERFNVLRIFVDAGHLGSVVREYCASDAKARCVKGIGAHTTGGKVTKAGRDQILLINVNSVKDSIHAFAKSGQLKHSNSLTGEAYQGIYASEYRTPKGWKVIRTGSAGSVGNHYLDCLVYSMALALDAGDIKHQ